MSSYESVQSAIVEQEQATARPAGRVAGILSAVAQRISCTATRLSERWRARRAYDAFSRLDGHTLADIGANQAEMFVATYTEDHGCPAAANSNEPLRPHSLNTNGVA